MANQNLSARLNVGVAQIVVPGTSAGLVSASGLPGSTTGSAIATTFVGETVTGQVLIASAISLVSGTPKDVATIVLTTGIWNITAYCGWSGSATSCTQRSFGVSTTANTLPSADSGLYTNNSTVNINAANEYAGAVVVAASAANTYRLVGGAAFSGGTVSIFGTIRAVRIA